MVTIIWLIQSGDGVMIAATTRIATNAYVRYVLRNYGVTRPILVKT
jgi:hypothetical protein